MTHLDNEINRIATFGKWQLSYPSAFNLARAGLAYTGTGDTVYCYKCHCVISDWKSNDIPLDRHRQCSPNCSLVMSLPAYRSQPGDSISHPSEDTSRPQNPIQQPSLYQPVEPSLIHLAPAPFQVPTSSLRADEPQTGAHLKLESVRLRTFDSWTNPNVNVRDLAKAGFFFTRIGDCVKCAFCSNILKQWEPGDVPIDEHRKHYSKCPFVLGLDVGNIPDYSMMSAQSSRMMQPHHDIGAVMEGGALGSPQMMNARSTHIIQPDHSIAAKGGAGKYCSPLPMYMSYETRNSLNFDVKFADLQQRLHSFENIPLPKGQRRQVLAEAGFYYVGPGDSVKCFQCGGVLKKWSEADEPWVEHARWFPNCIFLLQTKGYKFINDIQRQFNGSGVMLEQNIDISSQMETGDEDTMPKLGIEETEQEELTSLKQEFLPSSTSVRYPPATSVETVNAKLPVMVTHPSEMPPSEMPPSTSEMPPPTSEMPPPTSLPTTTPLKSPKAASEDVSSMAKENERLKEAVQCKICMDAMANTVFLPCGHLLCCERCAPAIIDCPVCRGIIKGTLKVYIS